MNDIFENDTDFEMDHYDLEDMMTAFSKFAHAANDLTKLCVETELTAGNKLTSVDVQNLYKQNIQIITGAIEHLGPSE